MRPEIKQLCNNLIENNFGFNYDDACDLCDHTLRHLGLCFYEYVAALEYIFIGLSVEQEGEVYE